MFIDEADEAEGDLAKGVGPASSTIVRFTVCCIACELFRGARLLDVADVVDEDCPDTCKPFERNAASR